MTIEVHLDRLLVERTMKLSELADIIGVSNVNLSKIKPGKIKAIRFSTLTQYVKSLIVNLELLEYK